MAQGGFRGKRPPRLPVGGERRPPASAGGRFHLPILLHPRRPWASAPTAAGLPRLAPRGTREKRPRDVVANAVRVMKIATGKWKRPSKSRPPASELGRRGGNARQSRDCAAPTSPGKSPPSPSLRPFAAGPAAAHERLAHWTVGVLRQPPFGPPPLPGPQPAVKASRGQSAARWFAPSHGGESPFLVSAAR